MSARREAILKSVDDVLAAYLEWQKDEREVQIDPDSLLADYLIVCDGTLRSGDIPQDCTELVLEARKLMVAYERYVGGDWVTDSLEPTERFYRCMRAVQIARVEASPPEAAMVEPVRQLRAESVPDRQIARMYGTRHPDTGIWQGPFFKNGAVVSQLIQDEAEHPGSVIPDDWVHPNQVAASQRFEEDMQHRLQRIDNRAAAARDQKGRRTVRPSEEEVLEYLEEGAFPNQVFKRWKDSGITRDEIDEIIKRHDITPSTKDDPTSPADRLSAKDAALMEPPERDADEKPTSEYSPEAFSDRVLELSASGLAPKAIRTTVQNEFGQQFSPQKIAAVIRDASLPAGDTKAKPANEPASVA